MGYQAAADEGSAERLWNSVERQRNIPKTDDGPCELEK
jgi:hypothetical protein